MTQDPHTSGRADLFTVYGQRDQAHEDEGMEIDFVKTTIGQLNADFSQLMENPEASSEHIEAMRRRLTDRSELIDESRGGTPPPGLTRVRTYRLCIGVGPAYIAFAKNLFPDDGAMGLIATTIARASGIWRRSLGISFVLCDKQANLLKEPQCDEAHLSSVSGCDGSQCVCEFEPQNRLSAKSGASYVNGAWINTDTSWNPYGVSADQNDACGTYSNANHWNGNCEAKVDILLLIPQLKCIDSIGVELTGPRTAFHGL
eukprot:COSAG05_NODE_6_length_45604_cov_26.489660_12_plen_258_part_00